MKHNVKQNDGSFYNLTTLIKLLYNWLFSAIKFIPKSFQELFSSFPDKNESAESKLLSLESGCKLQCFVNRHLKTQQVEGFNKNKSYKMANGNEEFHVTTIAQYFCKRSRSRLRLKKFEPEPGSFLTG